MVTLRKRNQVLLTIIKKLDISPSVREIVEARYRALENCLNENGVACRMYPQGSFALGTVVRPIKDYLDADFDLDVICEVSGGKENMPPEKLRNMIGKIIRNSYDNIEEFDECFTIHFADIDSIGLNLDVVPAVHESEAVIERIRIKADDNVKQLVDTSIAIPNCNKWMTNNPLGYKEWFDKNNHRFKKYNREQRKRLFEKSRINAAERVALPSDNELSSLQIAIQILKRHRDVFFNNYDPNKKPISAIITTLAAMAAIEADESMGPIDLAGFILIRIKKHSELTYIHESKDYKVDWTQIITKSRGKWTLRNPVNPEDNLMDSWNEKGGEERAKLFFMWLDNASNLLSNSFRMNERDFVKAVREGFGSDIVMASGALREFSVSENLEPQRVTPAKPWRS